MKVKLIIFCVTSAVATILGQSWQYNSFKEIKIGDQIWMTENLNTEKFRNGDLIPKAETDDDWKNAGINQKPAWCYFKNNPANGSKYGKLYNWYAVNDSRGLAPKGWHIPNKTDWTVLIEYLGGMEKASMKMKNKVGWEEDGNGTNESGFSALPGGSRLFIGNFTSIGGYGSWWSSTTTSKPNASSLYLVYDVTTVGRVDLDKGHGFSVRCIKD